MSAREYSSPPTPFNRRERTDRRILVNKRTWIHVDRPAAMALAWLKSESKGEDARIQR